MDLRYLLELNVLEARMILNAVNTHRDRLLSKIKDGSLVKEHPELVCELDLKAVEENWNKFSERLSRDLSNFIV